MAKKPLDPRPNATQSLPAFQLVTPVPATALVNCTIGPMVDHVTDKYDYMSGRKRVPFSLFAHNAQQQSTQSVHAQEMDPSGVLGRIHAALRPSTRAAYSSGESYGAPTLRAGKEVRTEPPSASPAAAAASCAITASANSSRGRSASGALTFRNPSIFIISVVSWRASAKSKN